MDTEALVRQSYLEALSTNQNAFDVLEKTIAEYYDKPCHDFGELRRRQNKKERGDRFEQFCKMYLIAVCGFRSVWLLSEVPEDVLAQLQMVRKDLGIDIVCMTEHGEYSAVQVKYRKCTGKKRILTWKTLSTFYALCLRTGPWSKYIVMTNCDYIRGVGTKTPKDKSICLSSFRNIQPEKWVQMAGITGHQLGLDLDRDKGMDMDKDMDKDLIREARLRRFNTDKN